MSEDLIRREDAIKAVRSVMGSYVPFLSGINVTLPIECETALRTVPSSDRPQGEWIDKGDYAECSNCGGNSGTQFDGVEPVPRKTKFCPSCGAKMKGADDE